jgi:hypothetical protein
MINEGGTGGSITLPSREIFYRIVAATLASLECCAIYATVYPNTSSEEKGKGTEARSQKQMSMSESRYHSPQISRNSKLSNYHGVSQVDCTKRDGKRHCTSDLRAIKHRIPGDRCMRPMVSFWDLTGPNRVSEQTSHDVMSDDSICSKQSCSTVVVEFRLSQSAMLSLDIPLHQNFHVSIKKCIAVAASTRVSGG